MDDSKSPDAGGLPVWVEELGALVDGEAGDLARLEVFFAHWKRADASLDEGARERIWARITTAPSPPGLGTADAAEADAEAAEGA